MSQQSEYSFQVQTNMRELRLENKLSQKKLAEKIGISAQYMSALETGAGKLTDARAKKIAKALKMTIPLSMLFYTHIIPEPQLEQRVDSQPVEKSQDMLPSIVSDLPN